MIYNKEIDQILLCKRSKNPYKGLSNLVGGKIEAGETSNEAAYRELYEKTGITNNDITMQHLMGFTYYLHQCYVEVYVGRLNHDVNVTGDENQLYWSDLNQDFFNQSLFAGEGNIGHMIEQVKLYIDQLFTEIVS
jgi:8-oxo-dGTP diphosphatase